MIYQVNKEHIINILQNQYKICNINWVESKQSNKYRSNYLKKAIHIDIIT